MGYVAPRRDRIVEDMAKMRRERFIWTLVLLVPTIASWAMFMVIAWRYIMAQR